jgi:hypothetical protein
MDLGDPFGGWRVRVDDLGRRDYTRGASFFSTGLLARTV